MAVTVATLKQAPVPSPRAATATPSPGDRFSRGIKQNSTEGHRDSTRPFLPLQGRDEPREIPPVSLCLILWEKGKEGEGKLSASCACRKPENKRQGWQGSREVSWPPTSRGYGQCCGEKKCWVTSSNTRRDLVWVKAFCRS